MKTYNQTNFFNHTFCEFTQVDDFNFPEKKFKSKSNSEYYYTEKGVYRKSNHWGRVANCRWKLTTKGNYKNQKTVIGFAKWTDFYPTNSDEKLFWIAVNYEELTVKIKATKKQKNEFLLNLPEAQQKVKAIKKLLSNEKWAKHFSTNIAILRREIIKQYLTSNKTILDIKRTLK